MTKRWPRVLLAALLLGAGVLAWRYRGHLDIAALRTGLDAAGAAGPLLFILVYAVGAVLFLPGLVLTLSGGALFGPVWGTVYNLAGATLGATLAFLVARYLAADWVQARAGQRLGRLIRGVEAEGWRFVAFTRLVPLFPFNLLNYALGLTRIPLGSYVLTSLVCMLPAAVAYTYLGYAGGETLAGGEGLIEKALLALALLAGVAFVPRLVGRLRQGAMLDVGDLKRRLDAGEPLLVLDVRTAAEFRGETGHIRGALNLPLQELPSRWPELGADPERPIAIVCRTDVRSARAAALLARRGFAAVHVVRGGMTAWLDRGWPVEQP